jgi:fimbrial isopeptide formation D2 family protein/LPXTG-motif cell wall-anchored protein
MKENDLFKRIAAFLTAMIMLVGCMMVNISAATRTSTLWDTSDSNDVLTVKSYLTGRSYEAYQLFYGDASNSVLSNVEWGASVKNSKAIVQALKRETLADGRTNPIYEIFKDLDDDADADKVAEKVYSIVENSSNADTFAYIVVTALKAQSAESITAGAATPVNANDLTEGYHYSFGAVHDGYYLIQETTATLGDGETASRIMVKVQGPTLVVTKATQAPTLTKDIVLSDGTTAKYDDVAVGDTVTFKLSSKVPNMSGYNKYFFIMQDTLSKGLTYTTDTDNMVVKVGDKTLTRGTDYYVKTPVSNADGSTTIKIVFKNFIQYAESDAVTVTYNATVNKDVTYGNTTDNYNKANLIYSNNPNVSYVGKENTNPDNPNDKDKDEPDDKEGSNETVGETKDSKVYVYTTALNILKVNPGGQRLTGAKFTIEGTGLNTVVEKSYTYTPVKYYDEATDATTVQGNTVYYLKEGSTYNFEKTPTTKALEPVKYTKNGDTYEKDINGTYYKNITKAEPVYETKIASDATYETDVIVYEQTITTDEITKSEKLTWEVEVGDNGEVTIEGIPAGYYTITEIKAPDGYNVLENPIKMEVSYTVDNEMKPTFDFGFDENGSGKYTKDVQRTVNGIHTLRVENKEGTTLPSTGGMGTTIFYIAGSALLLGATVLLIAKRRMKNEIE